MANVTLTAEDIISQMRLELSDLHHRLMVSELTTRKLAERLDVYEAAEQERIPVPKPLRRLSAAVEELPEVGNQTAADTPA